jgi:protein-tyrosine phosphatase
MSATILSNLARSVNLRELGGIAADDGRTVRPGLLFRSASLDELAPQERAAVARLGVRSIIDLRYNSERAARPTPWRDLGCLDYWADDYEPSGQGGDLSDLLNDRAITREMSRGIMLNAYAGLAYNQVSALRRLFRLAAAGEGPVLFHCTSGKDRTGISAALLLTALGVPRETIVTDYLKSLDFDVLASAAFRDLAPEQKAVFEPLYRVHADYLEAMFTAIEAREGSVEAFLTRTLEISPQDLERLRRTLLA